MNPSKQKMTDMVSSVMELSHIGDLLQSHGCKDLTSSLDLRACTKKPLTGGGYGDVYQGSLQDGTRVAIKTIRQYEYELQGAMAGKFYKRLAKELYTWSKCNHPNIMELLGWAVFNDSFAMISKWMDQGNLSRYLEDHPLSDRYRLSSLMCEGLLYLHTKNIVHGDLKAANVLVSSEGIPMLTDFGNASIGNATLRFTHSESSPTFSARWTAPEVLNGKNPTPESDIYALGMTILEVLTSEVPFVDVNDRAIICHIVVKKKIPVRPQSCIPSGIITGDRIWDLLTRCWSYEPEARPKISNVNETMHVIASQGPNVANNYTLYPSVKPTIEPTPPLKQDVIALNMPLTELVNVLTRRDCVDLTQFIDINACSNYPVANGGLGDVFRGRLLDGTQVAIKTIRPHHSNDRYLKLAAKEIYTWSKCIHPNVVKLLGLAMFRDSLAMISHWEENGNLPYYLTRCPSADRCQLSTLICAGLSYLHDNNIVHGSVKGSNILVSRDGTPMLTDFGDAGILSGTLQFTATVTGPSYSLRWTAPEIVIGQSGLTAAGDIYSLGMTILETFTSKVPFATKTDPAVLAAVAIKRETPPRPRIIIPESSISGNILWALLMSCWAYNPKRRPNASTVWDTMKTLTAENLMVIEDESEESDRSE